VCRRVSQCAAVFCSVWQCFAERNAYLSTISASQRTYQSVLQCVTVCCSVLQYVAAHWTEDLPKCIALCCSVSQCVAVHRIVLQRVAVCRSAFALCCSVLQCFAVCCNVLQCDAYLSARSSSAGDCSHCIAVCCSVLQCVAVCCSVLQYVALCESVSQCVAVCRSVSQFVAVCRSVSQCVAVRCIPEHKIIVNRGLINIDSFEHIRHVFRGFDLLEILKSQLATQLLYKMTMELTFENIYEIQF